MTGVPAHYVGGSSAAGWALVMGVLNVTPDSFSDGGRWLEPTQAIAHGTELLAEGADLVDVGGESTRPGAARPPEAEELRRVLPVVKRAGRRRGARIDRHDAGHRRPGRGRGRRGAGQRRVRGPGRRGDAAVRGAAGVPYVCMHWRGHADQMQSRADYVDVVAEVAAELRGRIRPSEPPASRPTGSRSTRALATPRPASTTGPFSGHWTGSTAWDTRYWWPPPASHSWVHCWRTRRRAIRGVRTSATCERGGRGTRRPGRSLVHTLPCGSGHSRCGEGRRTMGIVHGTGRFLWRAGEEGSRRLRRGASRNCNEQPCPSGLTGSPGMAHPSVMRGPGQAPGAGRNDRAIRPERQECRMGEGGRFGINGRIGVPLVFA